MIGREAANQETGFVRGPAPTTAIRLRETETAWQEVFPMLGRIRNKKNPGSPRKPKTSWLRIPAKRRIEASSGPALLEILDVLRILRHSAKRRSIKISFLTRTVSR